MPAGSAARVIQFPSQVTCPVCRRSCGHDELSTCYTCEEQYCGNCSECSCDRVAKELREITNEHEAGKLGWTEEVHSYWRRVCDRVLSRIA